MTDTPMDISTDESRKRPIEAMQPDAAAKRVRVTEVNPPHKDRDEARGRSYDLSGFLHSFSARFSRPHPIHDTIYIVVDTANYEDLFGSFYDQYISALFPDLATPPAGSISKASFVKVTRYHMKSRIDHIYSKVSGRRPNGRIPVASEFQLPKAVADVINSIGCITVAAGALPVVPEPEPQPTDQALSLGLTVTHQMLSRYSMFTHDLVSREFCRAASISLVPEGTAAYLLTARLSSDTTTIANGSASHVRIFSIFPEFTPADALLAAMTQNRFIGLFAGREDLDWSCDDIRGVESIRAAFALQS